jgi:hypothetical protein
MCSIGGGADRSTPARGIQPDVSLSTEAAKRTPVNRRLAIYLNDHLAGEVVGTELAKRALRETADRRSANSSSGCSARSSKTGRHWSA